MNEHKQSKFIIDVSAPAKRPNRSTTRFFSYDSHTAEIVIQAEKDGKLIDQALVDTVEIYFESVNLKYRPIDGLKWNDTMEIGTDGLYSYVLPDDFLNYEGLVAFDVYINYKNGDKADSSNRIIFEQRISAIDRAAGAVELVYIKDMETAKREITEQATEITENFLREWNAFEDGSTAKMQELDQRIDEQTEIFNNADVYNKAEIEDKLEPFALQTDIAEVSAQLAENVTQLDSIENANSSEIVRINNYLGNFQNIHPKVLYFSEGWNGYKYWMAYTPYPQGTTSAENPCIAVSNDMVTWTVPTGLINPLDPAPASGYNSDTHLLHRSDTGVMEIWWRQYRDSDGMRIFYRRTSTDGVNWTAKETIFTVANSEEMLSPAVIFEDGKYKLWFVRDGVRYRESVGSTISSWTEPVLLNIAWTTVGVTPWHLDVIKTEIGYELLVQGFKAGESNNRSDLYYVLNKTDGTFTLPKRVLAKSKNPTAIDHTGIYRSSFIKVNGVYYVFYSCLDKVQNRWMAIAYGDSISGLNGFNYLRSGERVLTLTDAGNVEIDVSQYDTIKILGTGTTTITMIRGGYVGKKISVILGSNTATLKCIINSNGGYLALPLQKNITLEYGGKTSANLICYQDTPGLINSGWWWRTDSYVPPNIVKTKKQIGAGVVATDFNVSGVDIIELTGAGSTINSFVGGYVGQVIHIICSSAVASTTFVYSSRLLPPGLANYAIDISKMGVTAVCMHGDTWRVF